MGGAQVAGRILLGFAALLAFIALVEGTLAQGFPFVVVPVLIAAFLLRPNPEPLLRPGWAWTLFGVGWFLVLLGLPDPPHPARPALTVIGGLLVAAATASEWRQLLPSLQAVFASRAPPEPAAERWTCAGSVRSGELCRNAVPIQGGLCHAHRPRAERPTTEQVPEGPMPTVETNGGVVSIPSVRSEASNPKRNWGAGPAAVASTRASPAPGQSAARNRKGGKKAGPRRRKPAAPGSIRTYGKPWARRVLRERIQTMATPVVIQPSPVVRPPSTSRVAPKSIESHVGVVPADSASGPEKTVINATTCRGTGSPCRNTPGKDGFCRRCRPGAAGRTSRRSYGGAVYDDAHPHPFDRFPKGPGEADIEYRRDLMGKTW